VIRLVGRSLGAHWRSGRTLFALTVFGVALGVASVLSIQILNENAIGAFEGSVRAVSGEADLTVLGRTPSFPETTIADVLADPAVASAWPLYRVDVRLDGPGQRYLEILGADLFAPMRIPWDGDPGDLGAALAVPGWAAVSPELAGEMGWSPGDRFVVLAGSRRVELTVGALVDFARVAPTAGRRLAVVDIAQAQARLGRPGGVHQIDVVLRDGADVVEAARRLESRLGPAVRVLRPEQREKEAAGLMGAFRLNVTALSMISLFVGAFLVHAATQASLVRRRAEFGVLRSLGATRGQVLGAILAETAVLGALGTAVGLPLGWLAARANLDVVSATLSNLYLLNEIETLRLSPWLVALAIAVGAVGAVGGALVPAAEIARRHPRELLAAYTLHERVGARSARIALAGLVPLVAAVALWPAYGRFRAAGFVLAFGALVAVPAAAPWVVRAVAGRVPVRGFSFAYGVRTLRQRLHTTFVAVAALSVAVAMLVGITVMIGSFRRTVGVWLDASTAADVYVSAASWRRARAEAWLDPAFVDGLRSLDGVVAVDTLRQFFGYTGDRRVSIAGFPVGLPGVRRTLSLIAGDPREAERAAIEDGAVWVSEPLARKERLGVGDRLPLHTPDGPVDLPIAGVYRDYSSELGGVLMDVATLDRLFGPGPPHNAALYLAAGVDPERIVDRIRARFPEVPVEARSNRTLRAEVFAIFDQTFAVTRLLQAMSLLIAVAGVTLTLLVLARERVAELALYRALGAARPQLFRVFLGKGLGIAAFGLALGWIGGAALAVILVYVINRAFFGWTLAVHVPWTELVVQAGAVLAAALAASVYPAVRASRTPATELNRDDL